MSITVKGTRFYPTGQLTSIPFHSFMGSRRKHKIPVVVQLLSPVWLCEPTDCSMPGFPVLHHFPEFVQTPFHWVSDAIQLPHPLSSTSSPSVNLFQHQGLFQWVGSLHQVAKVLEHQHQSFQGILDWFPLGLTGLISLQSKGLSRVFSNTTVQNHQFFSTQLSL